MPGPGGWETLPYTAFYLGAPGGLCPAVKWLGVKPNAHLQYQG